MKKLIFLSILLTTCFVLIQAKEHNMQNKHTVVVILEAKPEKAELVKKELMKVKQLSEQEDTCIAYHVHEDIDNPARIVLYEHWTSKEDHAKQFEKPYILELVDVLQDALAKPYTLVMAKELS